MNRRTFLIVISSALIAAPAFAIPVFDSANYAENMLTAARTLEQINNQVRSLQNETTMLQNMARNLQKLDMSYVGQMTTALRRVESLMGQANGVTLDVTNTSANFQRLYPKEYADSVNSNQLVLDARTRWEASRESYRDAMVVQSQVAANVQEDRQLLDDLVAQSQGAVGSMQAQQATNQLLALSAKQQLQIQNMMVTQFRSDAMDRARSAAAEEEGRANFRKFMGDRKAYTPRN